MSNYEREASIRPSIFDGTNFVYWKVRAIAYLQSLGTEVWDIIDIRYTFPSETPTDPAEKKKYETNAKTVNTLLGCLSQSEFVNVMQYKSVKEIWDKIVLSYEGDDQVKQVKLQTLRIQYENIRMHNDESVANYFLRVDEIVNCMRNLGEEIKEAFVVEQVLRSLSPKFESKVSEIEEKENLRNLTMSQLHGILTAYEMRKGGPSDRREAAFKASGKGDYYELGHASEEEEESNFVKPSTGYRKIHRSMFWKTTQKEQTSSARTWRMKEPQPERWGIDLYAEGQENQWYIDSGCSKHMTGDKGKLESYSVLEKGKKVSSGNDTPAVIKGKGTSQLKEKVKARNVLYVDGLKHNLLSVIQMCDQGTEVIFRSNGCSVHDLDIGKTMIKGRRTPNNLYIFEEGQQ
eukprot:PITA_01870